MVAAGLQRLARFDERGRPEFRIVENDNGEFVLSAPDRPAPQGYRPLDGVECMRVAALAPSGPSLVVENGSGDYVVLVDGQPERSRHIPLDLDDAELLAAPEPPIARFGRRDDDILELTPWAPDGPTEIFDPDAPGYGDVPVVALTDHGLVAHRGDLEPDIAAFVHEQLEELGGPDPDSRYGVFTNPFGEFAVVPVGGPIEPHEDVRRQTVLRARGLLDGVTTLDEASASLRALADRMDAATAQGWRLPDPIRDDHGFPERDPG